MAVEHQRDSEAEGSASGEQPASGTRARNGRALARGMVVDRYRVEELLGAGGMGEVYEVTHMALDKRCAMKLMNADLAHAGNYRDRFLREAKASVKVAHPNVVKVDDYGDHGGSLYLVMELLKGETLRARLKRVQRLGVVDALRIMLRVIHGVNACHRAGIVHRDLKPENIFLAEQKQGMEGTETVPIVLDLGIAKLLPSAAPGPSKGPHEPETRSGVMIGTWEYMAPEQIEAKDAREPADQFSLGLILRECLTGEIPAPRGIFFPGSPYDSNPGDGVPPAVARVISRMTQYKREERFADLAQVAAALEAILAPPIEPPVHERSVRGPILALLAGFAIAAGALYAWQRPRATEPPLKPPQPIVQPPAPQPHRDPRPPTPPPLDEPKPATMVRVVLDVVPSSANVELDGMVTPQRELELEAESEHSVVVEAKGFQRLARRFQARPGPLALHLKAKPPRQPPATEAQAPAPAISPGLKDYLRTKLKGAP